LESIPFFEDDHLEESIFIENLGSFEKLMSFDNHRDKLMDISYHLSEAMMLLFSKTDTVY